MKWNTKIVSDKRNPLGVWTFRGKHMMNINLDKQCVDLSIESDKYPMQLVTGNPFMISRGFDLLANDQPYTGFAVQDAANNKIDEGVLKFLDKQVTYALNRTTRIPKNVLVLTNLGVSYLTRRNYDAAIKTFLEALNIDPLKRPEQISVEDFVKISNFLVSTDRTWVFGILKK